MNTLRLLLASAALGGLTAVPAFAQGTAFTYQGVLSQGGAAVNGSNDLTFTLYNSASGGTTVGTSNVVNDLVMTEGLFTVTLDFGAGAFDGSGRWLQIAARPGASVGGYTNLAPRTPITPTPYAIYAGGATAAGLIGALPASALSGVNGGGLINLNATNLAGTVPTARLSTNVALRAGGNEFSGDQIFLSGSIGLGTATPGNLLDVAAGGIIGNSTVKGLNLHDTLNRGTKVSFGYNILGSEFLGMSAAVNPGTALCGNSGDLLFYTWECNTAVSREVMRINGRGNVGIGTNSPSARLDVVGTIRASGNVHAGGSVGIGTDNPATRLTVNQYTYGIEHTDGTRRLSTYIDESGCYFGTVSTDPLLFYVNDQGASLVVNTNGRVGIGALSPVSELEVAGTVTATGFSGNGGGLTGIDAGSLTGNLPDSSLSANVARRDEANIFSGDQRINGGSLNVPNGQISVGGALLVGGNQTVSGAVTANSFSGIGSGLTGIAAGSVSGTFGTAQIPNLDAAKIASGSLADARLSANVALRSGGNTFGGNQIFNGNVGIGASTPATKLHLLGAGDTELSIQSTDNNRRWTLQASSGPDGNPTFLGGYFQIIDRTAGASRLQIETGGNVTIPAELTTTAVNITSDRNAKEQFKPVNAREVLDKVVGLPISEWQYKTQGDARHIGPMAQDFHEAFSLGHDDKHITSVDADGVALAAIQGLNEVVREQRNAIEKLETRNRELEERLAGRLATLEKLMEQTQRHERP